MIGNVSIVRILNGISKTLEIIQKVSPLYTNIKPLLTKLSILAYNRSDVISSNNNVTNNTISFFK